MFWEYFPAVLYRQNQIPAFEMPGGGRFVVLGICTATRAGWRWSSRNSHKVRVLVGFPGPNAHSNCAIAGEFQLAPVGMPYPSRRFFLLIGIARAPVGVVLDVPPVA